MRWLQLRRSLIVRLVGWSLLLLLIVQVAGFVVVRASIDRNARAQIAHALDLDQNVWQQLLAQNASQLRQGSALLAADYGFRSAVSSGDTETIQSVLENHGGRIGASIVALLDTRMELWAASFTHKVDGFDATLQQVVAPLAAQPEGSQIAVIDGIPYQFVMVPMRAPVLIGWVLMGFAVDQARADEMHRLLAVDVALRVTDAKGVVTVPVSTLPAEALALLKQHGGPALWAMRKVSMRRRALARCRRCCCARSTKWSHPTASCKCCWPALPWRVSCCLPWLPL